MGSGSARSADFGYAAVAPEVRKRLSVGAQHVLASWAPTSFADCTHFDPDILEQTLKPIAYTEQAAAVAFRDQTARSRVRIADYRDVVAKGATYSGVDVCRGQLSP